MQDLKPMTFKITGKEVGKLDCSNMGRNWTINSVKDARWGSPGKRG